MQRYDRDVEARVKRMSPEELDLASRGRRLRRSCDTRVSEDEARRQIHQEFGGIEQVKEVYRDARGTRWLEDLSQDIRFAIRTLTKRPGFLLTALSTLGVGTAAVTVIFTLIHSVLLRPLPYPELIGLLPNMAKVQRGIALCSYVDRREISDNLVGSLPRAEEVQGLRNVRRRGLAAQGLS